MTRPGLFAIHNVQSERLHQAYFAVLGLDYKINALKLLMPSSAY